MHCAAAIRRWPDDAQMLLLLLSSGGGALSQSSRFATECARALTGFVAARLLEDVNSDCSPVLFASVKAADARHVSLLAQLRTPPAVIDEPIADLGHADAGCLLRFLSTLRTIDFT